MKVALVHDWLNGMRGGEKVLEQFCELFPGATIFTLFFEPEKISQTIRSHRVVSSPLQSLPLTKKYYRYFLPFFPWAIGRFELKGYDLVISISHCAAKGVRVPGKTPHICYCLSPMRYIWDHFDSYFKNKGIFSPVRLGMKMLRHPLQRWDAKTAEKIDFFIAISRYISKKIKQYLHRDSIIIHPPVNTDFFCPDFKEKPEKRNYFLVVSALAPYKKVGLVVDTFRKRGEKLVIVGSGPRLKSLKNGAPRNVRFLGWQTDEKLLELYRNCKALIFAQEEDFGIAPLEAMACGKPVIAYEAGGALETVVPGKTGVFFKAQTEESLAGALDAFREEAFDPGEIRAHALGFSNENFRNAIKAYLKEKVNF